MKKTLALVLTLAMGISVNALAANPFSDVPAGHWAYGSIAKLAAAGIVDGYGDGTYRGDRLMTRYEMAQIVARAMAKGANVDRLASEFADELDSLGVRVAKLEKKSDNVKITGEARYSYADATFKEKYGLYSVKFHPIENSLRSRIWFTGAVNDNWDYVGMLENYHEFSNDMSVGGHKSLSSEEGEGTAFQRAYLQGRLGGAKVTAGRQDFTLVDGNLYDTRMDGIKAEYGSKVKVGAYYGRPTDEDSYFSYDKFYGANVNGNVGKLNLTAGYDKFMQSVSNGISVVSNKDNSIWNVGAKYDFGQASLGVIYMKANMELTKGFETLFDNDNKGVIVTGTLKGAKKDQPGSWGLWAKYYNQGLGTVIAHTMNGLYEPFYLGFKGWGTGVDYTLAKNMVASVEYYDLSAKNSKYVDASSKTWWGQLNVTF
jgi:hypothetical protein